MSVVILSTQLQQNCTNNGDGDRTITRGNPFKLSIDYCRTNTRKKLAVIMHRCRHGKAPQYLVDCCTPVTDVVGRQRLRSTTQQLMVVPRHRLTTVGCRAFAVHGPMVWNPLPDDLRAQQDYESFRKGLKTWLFSRY